MENLDIQINVGHNSLIVIKSVDFSKTETEGTMDVDYEIVRGSDDASDEALVEEGLGKFTSILEEELKHFISLHEAYDEV